MIEGMIEVGEVAKGEVVELGLWDRGRLDLFQLTVVKKKKYTVDVATVSGTIWNLDNDTLIKLV